MKLHRMVFRGLLVFGTFLSQIHVQTAMGQVHPRVTEAVDDARRTALSGNVHPLARAEFDRGAVADSQPMNRILLLLKRSDEQEATLQDTLAKQQDKSSPTFHQWLTPEQFGAQFGPADADIQAVTDWLTRQGFSVGKIYSGKTVIEFSGTAGQVQRAFGTAIRNYQVNGKLYSANSSDPQIPAALAPVVTGVVTLHNFPREFYARRFGNLRRAAGKSVVEPLVTLPNPFGPGSFYGLGPGDFAKIYGVPVTCGTPAGACNGSGQTIAIVGETNLVVADVQQFRSVFGLLPATFNASNIVYNGEDPGVTSTNEEAEADLDTQWSGGVAPGATIKYVLSASTSASQGVDLSALYIVEHNMAAVMSESYGGCESSLGSTGNSFYNSLWQQASAQGITVAVSTGDSGSAGCDDPNTENLATKPPGVNGLASTPYNVAVGGTDFDEYNNWSAFWNTTNDPVTGASAKGYIPEIPWNQSCAQLGATGCNINTTPVPFQNILAGGGGPSQYNKPSWQMGIAGMPSDGKRDLPDISLLASPGFNGTGYLYCQGDVSRQCLDPSGFNGSFVTFGVIGGTSASAPAFAGIMALINQSQATAQVPAPRQGNTNYVLYALANKSGASCASATPVAAGCVFNDITLKGSSALPTGGTGIGTISVPCKGGVVGCSATLAAQIGVLDDPNNPGTMAWNAGVGYDRATGLGSLNVGNLITSWGTVASVPTTTTLALSPVTGITHGSNENVSVTISVKPQSGTAKGDVSLIARFADGTTQGLNQFTLAANGSFSGMTNSLPGGNSYSVTAHYTGDGTDAPSDSAPVMVTVAAESSKTFASLATYDLNHNIVSFGSANGAYGAGFNFFRLDVGGREATLSPTTGISSDCSRGITNCPSGAVSVTSTGASVGITSGVLNNEGFALSPPLFAGSYSVSASYPGDSSYSPSTGSTNFVIAKAPTTITAGYAGTPVQYGNAEEIVANVATTSVGVAPTGTFQFIVDGNPVPNLMLVYESSDYNPSSSPTSYAWLDATSTNGFLSVGNHTLAVSYSGDANYIGGTSPPVTVPVSQALPDIGTWGANPATINLGQQTTLMVQLFGSAAGAQPTGTITFYDGTTALSGIVNYNPTTRGLNASMPYTPTAAGTHNINVSYSGDSNYLPVSTPVAASLSVVGPDFSLVPQNPTSVTVSAGNPATFTIQVSATDGFNGNVTFTCSLPAAAVSCTANPPTVAAGMSTTIKVTTMAHQSLPPILMSRRWDSPRKVPIVQFLAAAILILLFSVPRRRPRLQISLPAMLALLMLAMHIAGCGGGGGGSSGGGLPPQFGTQPGIYTVAVTGISSTTTHATSVSLTVN
jgi:subtilase family serine protease